MRPGSEAIQVYRPLQDLAFEFHSVRLRCALERVAA